MNEWIVLVRGDAIRYATESHAVSAHAEHIVIKVSYKLSNKGLQLEVEYSE
jgi:hypothetical protein